MRTLISALLFAVVAFVAGCGGVKHIDPPVFFESSPRAAALAAFLRAVEVKGERYEVAPTGSMEPLLKGGDYIVTSPVPFSAVQEGTILAYRPEWQPAGSPPVAHRYVGQDSEGLIMSGDANAHSEAQWRVTAKNYLGTVVAIYRSAP